MELSVIGLQFQWRNSRRCCSFSPYRITEEPSCTDWIKQVKRLDILLLLSVCTDTWTHRYTWGGKCNALAGVCTLRGLRIERLLCPCLKKWPAYLLIKAFHKLRLLCDTFINLIPSKGWLWTCVEWHEKESCWWDQIGYWPFSAWFLLSTTTFQPNRQPIFISEAKYLCDVFQL